MSGLSVSCHWGWSWFQQSEADRILYISPILSQCMGGCYPRIKYTPFWTEALQVRVQQSVLPKKTTLWQSEDLSLEVQSRVQGTLRTKPPPLSPPAKNSKYFTNDPKELSMTQGLLNPLQCGYSNRGHLKKTDQSQCRTRTMNSN